MAETGTRQQSEVAMKIRSDVKVSELILGITFFGVTEGGSPPSKMAWAHKT